MPGLMVDGGTTGSLAWAIMTGERVIARERRLARQGVVGDGAHRVDVGPDVEVTLAGRLLGMPCTLGVPLTVRSAVSWGATGSRVSLTRPKSSTLATSGLAASLGDEDVGRLQVRGGPRPDRVGLGQAGAGLAEQVDHPTWLQRAGFPDQILEAHPGEGIPSHN